MELKVYECATYVRYVTEKCTKKYRVYVFLSFMHEIYSYSNLSKKLISFNNFTS